MRGLCICGALLAALIGNAAAAAAPPSYGLTLIAVPSGASAVVPAAINASGAVTGTLTFPPGIPSHVFIYTSGVLTDLGTLVYPGSATYGAAAGQAINADGVIAGTVSDPGSPPMWSFGFLYDTNGVLTQLSNMSGFLFCTATGVNSASLIAGGCTSPLAGQTIAVDYQNGMATQLGPTGTTATPVAGTALNDYGQVAASGSAPFIAQGTTLTSIPLLAGSPGGTQANPTAINNAAQVVGWQLSGSSYQGFFAANGLSSALAGVPVSVLQPGIAINNAGQVVGFTQASSTAAVVPFFLANAVYSNLNTLISAADANRPYVTLTNAYAINDAGWIVATGSDSRTPGVSNAYLLRPTSAFPVSVQLASSVTSVAIGTTFTLAWTDQSAAACTASGGSGTDGWKGSVTVSGGQQQVREVNPDTYTFTLTCTDASSHSVDSTVSVTVTGKPAPGPGGSGALGALLLAALGAATLLRARSARAFTSRGRGCGRC